MMQPVRTLWWRVAVLFSICLMAATAFAQGLEVIALKHRTAQELLPALQPLLAPGGALSGQDYQLFVRTTNTNLAELRRVIAQLDKAPRQLLVSVRNATHQQLQREGAAISGVISTEGARARADIENSASQRNGEGIASVAVLEGNSAMINNGASIPIVTSIAGGGGSRPWIAAQTEYRNLTDGFVVTPRVSGDQVILEISQQSQKARNGRIENQQLQTQTSGRLGEWLNLGGVEQSSSTTQQGIGSRRYSTQTDHRSVWIKVDVQ